MNAENESRDCSGGYEKRSGCIMFCAVKYKRFLLASHRTPRIHGKQMVFAAAREVKKKFTKCVVRSKDEARQDEDD